VLSTSQTEAPARSKYPVYPVSSGSSDLQNSRLKA
jgi:hypothetical protein